MRRLLASLLMSGLAAVLIVLGTGAASPPGGSGYQVRAIFDNAAFAVSGEQVRIAGAPVGTITSLAVTRKNQAAVTVTINNAAFTPWHTNARCAIRPQSLIAERYIDCTPGTAVAPALPRITTGAGAGSHLLAVARTSSPIDPDIVQNISQEPVRQALSVILDELGTGLAARGADLGAVIRRANPALGYTDRVFRILAGQNHVLAKLASDSQTVLAPLARARTSISDFVTQADSTAVATAARSAALSDSIHLLPSFLSRLRPLMADLGRLAHQGTPLMSSLGQSASSLTREFTNLVPFARAARSALLRLGATAQRSQARLVDSQPLADRLLALGSAAEPSSHLLHRLTASLSGTGAIAQLMRVLFYGTQATNAFNQDGHYVRGDVVVGSCTGYARKPVFGCSANFTKGHAASIARAAVGSTHPARSPAVLTGLLHYLVGARR